MEKRRERRKVKRQFSAGGVVFKKLKSQNSKVKTYWLITKSKPSKEFPDDVWRLPKGWLDDSEDGKKPGPLARGVKKAGEEQIQEAAFKEVEEEGGVKAKILKRVSTDRYFFTNKEKERVLKFVTYFLMEWQEDVSGGYGVETEKVEWLDYNNAKDRLTYLREKEILKKAKDILDAGLQGNLI